MIGRAPSHGVKSARSEVTSEMSMGFDSEKLEDEDEIRPRIGLLCIRTKRGFLPANKMHSRIKWGVG